MKRTYLIATALLATAISAPPALAQVTGANNNGAAYGTANGGAVAGNNGGAGNNANRSGVAPGALVTISPSGVRQVQQALNRLGYIAGPVNGVWDRTTADAMLHFQEAHGLEPTGNLNLSSIAGLGLWKDLIGDPLGNGNKALMASNGSPPPRGGKKSAVIGGEPLPSQRLTTTGGNIAGGSSVAHGEGSGVAQGAGTGGAR